ncbi:hypothetical protein [Paenibacillus antri]|nr:hypothetical protein [Paenibacillus antri]
MKKSEQSRKIERKDSDEKLDERMDEVVHAVKHTFTGAGTEQGRLGK